MFQKPGFLLLFLLSISCCFAQEKILLLNGKEKEVAKVEGIQNKDLVYTSPGKHKTKKISINAVYSYFSSGKETIVYRQDSAVEYYLTPEQMRTYIIGEQYAIKNYTSNKPYYVGSIYGIAGGLVIPFFTPLSFIPPAIGLVLVSNRVPEPGNITDVDSKVAGSVEFISGYEQRARAIKINKTWKGAGLGMLGTLGILIITGVIK